MHTHDILILCGIIGAGFLSQWFAWRLRLPAILFLLFAGILAGPVLGWLDPDQVFGELLTPIVSVAVAVILFEGSLTLEFSEIRGHGSVVRNLVSVGVLVTWGVAALCAYYILGWDPYLAALFGAIVTVSGPTVVMPMLRAIRPTQAVSSVLRWESILVDPLGAILALLVFNVILANQSATDFIDVTRTVAIIVVTGSALGAFGGYLFGLAIRKRVIPDLLRDYSALATVLAVFATAESVQSESGFLAVTLMGVWLANMRDVDLEDVHEFKESISLLLIGGLFILLAAKLEVGSLLDIGYGAISILLILQFVGGPLRSFLSSIGSPLNWRERVFVGWVFPRGIVAAAVSSLFALRLVEINYPGADDLVPLVFSVIIGTVIIQSLLSKSVAKLLDVVEPDATGVLIVGANPVGLMYATALKDAGRQVCVADSHWSGIRNARMKGLPVFYGSPVSGYADDKLDMTGLGTLLATSRQPGINELSCVRFSREFGRDHVFTMGNGPDSLHEKHNVSGEISGRILFGGSMSIDDLVKRIRAGATTRSTELTDEFNFDAYRDRYPDSILIFAFDDASRLRFPVSDDEFVPGPGWKVTALT